MASIENVSLLITNSLGLQDGLQGVIASGFTLTSYADGTGTPTLSNGRTEEIAGALYRVIDGNLAVDMTSVSSDTTYFVYVEDTGTAITVKALSTVPTYRGDLGGYYLSGASTSKAVFKFTKVSTSYNARASLLNAVVYTAETIQTGALTSTSTITATTAVSTDTISERTSAAGVTIDGLKIKDSQAYTDVINEVAGSGNGVTVDGVLLKDSSVKATSITNATIASGVTVNGVVIGTGATNNEIAVDIIKEKAAAAGVTVDGVLLKDSNVTATDVTATNVTAGTTYTDVISEKTSGAGVTIDGVLLKDNKVTAKANYHGSLSLATSTQGTVYQALSPYIPTTGDTILVTGGFQPMSSSIIAHMSKAVRKSSTEITLYYALQSNPYYFETDITDSGADFSGGISIAF